MSLEIQRERESSKKKSLVAKHALEDLEAEDVENADALVLGLVEGHGRVHLAHNPIEELRVHKLRARVTGVVGLDKKRGTPRKTSSYLVKKVSYLVRRHG